MDTVVQAVRVSLLVLMTFAFATIWSADYSITRVVKHPPHNRQSIQPKIDSNEQSSPSEDRLSASLPSTTLASEFNLGIPLPEGISTGTYLIVNQFGRTTTRFIVQPRSNLDAKVTASPATDHYTSILGNTRWHFIRIESNVTDRIAVGPTSAAGTQ